MFKIATILTAAALSTLGCSKSSSSNSKASDAELIAIAKSEASTLVDAPLVLSCVGREIEGSNQFTTVSIQKSSTENILVLGINKIVINKDSKSDSVSRTGLALTSIMKIESPNKKLQQYVAVSTDGAPGATVVTYDASSEVMVIDQPSLKPFAIDCQKSVVY